GNIDWRFQGDRSEEDFGALQGKVDGVRVSRGACEGQGFPSVCQAADTARGLRGDYFNGTNFNTPKLTRIDYPMSLDWGLRSPDPIITPDTFSVRWTGSIVPTVTGRYTFYTTSDDGVK